MRIVTSLVLLAVLLPGLWAQETLLQLPAGPQDIEFGCQVGSAGDLDGDGQDDLWLTGRRLAAGQARDFLRLVRGSDGTTLLERLFLVGEELRSVVCPGDLDGDGQADFAVALKTPGFGPLIGSLAAHDFVRIVSGATGSDLGQLASPGGQIHGFGAGLAAIADLDGDGCRDIAVGSPFESTLTAIQGGAVLFYSGASRALIGSCHGPTVNEQLGTAVVPAGDVDGDGLDDVAALAGLGIYGTLGLVPNVRARVISGASLVSIRLMQQSSVWASGPETTLAAGRDLDGDAVPDLVIGRPADWTGGSHAGRVMVFSGANALMIDDLVGTPCQGIGGALDLGDVNGDGHCDLVIGTLPDQLSIPKEVRVIDGLTGEPMIDQVGDLDLVDGVTALPGFDADRFADLVLTRDLGQPGGFVRVVSGGPSLPSRADGFLDAGGASPERVLRLNGSDGGLSHAVVLGIHEPFLLEVLQPSTNGQPADFVIFGRVGLPMGDEDYQIPGLADEMVLVPAPLATWAIPVLFTLASSVGPMPGGQVLLTPPAPWSLDLPFGLGYPAEFCLQAVVMATPTEAVIANALAIRVH